MHKSSSKLSTLTVAALGVVYGDIGTSPLYAFKEAFAGSHPLPLSEANVLATLSILFWCMMLIVSLKYVALVLRFDNQGEGGVLALAALAHRLGHARPRLAQNIIAAGIFAAALFYGDAIITPAISVLSAVEGLSVATPQFEKMILPITVGILIGLFLVQKHGTGKIGGLFGKVTMLWFLSIGVLGVYGILQNPLVLKALNPSYALDFAVHFPGTTFVLLSAVFLALTGGEALYADMGHFGAKAVRIAWFSLVFPCLILNYFGQGALVLQHPEAVQNPFYLLAPASLLLPLVVLATAATVIASQATISGAYSMTLQASRLGYLPRVRVLHTSDHERGQIYIPTVNWMMLVAVVILVLQFRSSGALAAAYGIAVSGTMLITTVLTAFVVIASAQRRRGLLLLGMLAFGVLEIAFLSSNANKIAEGGWFPLVMGALIFVLLTTWKRGSALVAENRRKLDVLMEGFVNLSLPDVPRVSGTAVYLTSDSTLVPSALFHNLKHYKVLHERILFLHVNNEEIPYVGNDQRLSVKTWRDGIYQVEVRFGFREEPDIPAALSLLPQHGIDIESMATSYFVARSVIADGPGSLPRWQCNLYAWLTRQSEGAAAYYRLPANQVIELGTQVML